MNISKNFKNKLRRDGELLWYFETNEKGNFWRNKI